MSWPKNPIPTTINKNGPIIDQNLIQAKIYPEIINTHCWIISSKVKSTIKKHVKRNWEKINGPRPKNMCLCHKCDNINGGCVNPDHLFLGTFKDNSQDMSKKQRTCKGGFTSETAKKGWITRKINMEKKCYILEKDQL